jgi:hypothetical protein
MFPHRAPIHPTAPAPRHATSTRPPLHSLSTPCLSSPCLCRAPRFLLHTFPPHTTTYTHARRHSLTRHRTMCTLHPVHSGSAFLSPQSPLHPAGARLPQPDAHLHPTPHPAYRHSLVATCVSSTRQPVAACNTAHTIALSLPILASRIRGSFVPPGWAVACGLVGPGAWSGWKAKAFVQRSLIPAPITRPASRELTPTTRCLPSTTNKGLVLPSHCGRQWDAVCPSTSPTQLDMAAYEKRRSHDACLVTAAWSSKSGIMFAIWPSIASLHVEVGRDLDLHHLDVVVADR